MNPSVGIIIASGADAFSFLQGQLTQDTGRLAQEACTLAAWCNPKGRVISVARMLADGTRDDEIALAVPAELADAVLQRLAMYRLRAKVELRPASDWAAVAIAADADLERLAARGLLPDTANRSMRNHGIVTFRPGGSSGCVEVYGRLAALHAAGLVFEHPLGDAAWRLALIDAGIITLGTPTTEKYTPHMLNLDRVGAVSFNKGCYTGQEVVARTEHLGSVRRRLMHFRANGQGFVAGDKVAHGDGEVGEIVDVSGEHLLAVLPVELHDRTLRIGEFEAAPVGLPYELPARS